MTMCNTIIISGWYSKPGSNQRLSNCSVSSIWVALAVMWNKVLRVTLTLIHQQRISVEMEDII